MSSSPPSDHPERHAPALGIGPGRLLAALAGLAVVALLVVGLIQLAGSSSSSSSSTAPRLTLAEVKAKLAGSPAPLAALHAQANEILPADRRALDARIASLHGYPLVIDKWASWCIPCQDERASFQHVSAAYGRTVAFLGVDSADTSRAEARTFLAAYPEGFPSYFDKSGQLGVAVTGSQFTPVTVFYDRAGHEYIHQGPYPNAAKLERDVRRYALDR
jgi:cytochrome c biogenesis protein CcmG, thiol:disulfide interchange protein DsbE